MDLLHTVIQCASNEGRRRLVTLRENLCFETFLFIKLPYLASGTMRILFCQIFRYSVTWCYHPFVLTLLQQGNNAKGYQATTPVQTISARLPLREPLSCSPFPQTSSLRHLNGKRSSRTADEGGARGNCARRRNRQQDWNKLAAAMQCNDHSGKRECCS
jgi:hypothetical protein